MVKLDAGEMPAGRRALLHPVCGGRNTTGACAIFRKPRRGDVVQQPSTVEGFDSRRRKAAHPEWKPLQRRARILCLLQHQHREIGKAQLTGEKQADRAGAGNDDIIEGGVAVVHELLLCRCSTGAFLTFENHTDEHLDARRPMFVVGISCTRPETRAFVTERTWAYQTKSAFSDRGHITLRR